MRASLALATVARVFNVASSIKSRVAVAAAAAGV